MYAYDRRWTAALLTGLCFMAVSLPMQGQFQGPPVTTPVAPQLTGPAPNSPVTTTTALTAPVSTLITVSPGDVLEVNIIGVTNLNSIKPMVDADGNIALPYIGTQHVAGLSLPAIQSLISQKYRDGQYILNAQVNVQLTTSQNQYVAVEGEVKTPSLVPALVPRRLLDVLAAAGGLTPQASHLLTVSRKATGETLQVLLKSNPLDSTEENIPVYAGDTVIVPKAGEVYVIGSVKTPNAIPLINNTPLTLMQAISISGGVNFEAALSQVRVIRTEGAERKAISLDLKRVLDGKEADPILQADDIIYVPANYFKGGLKGGGLNTLLTGVIGFAYLLR